MEKKKISNSEELNKLYKIINMKIKKFSEMNIPHNKIANYLRPGSENFKEFIKEDEELRNVDGIERVLQDIIEDTYHAFKDGFFKRKKVGEIKTFESLIAESIYNLEEITSKNEHEHEKALADIYKVSMSYIDLINKDLHLYYVNDQGNVIKVIIFNKNEVGIIRKNIVQKLCEEIRKRTTRLLSDKTITLDELIGPAASPENHSDINDIVSAKLTDEDIINHIESNTGLEVKVKHTQKVILNSVEYFVFVVS